MNTLTGSLCDLDAFHGADNGFDDLSDEFQWSLPEKINVADLVCNRHASGDARLALIAENESGDSARYSFDDLAAASARLATVMMQSGVKPGDRVAVILPQRVETALVHIAAQRVGAVSLPLSILFGDDALQYRLADSGTSFLVVADERFELIESLQNSLPELNTVLRVRERGPVEIEVCGTSAAEPITDADTDFWSNVNAASPYEDIHPSSADDPAFLLYTSGTTGPPKGALIPQRALLGNLTGFECSHNGFPRTSDVVFTPADWAWTGGLLDGLLPAWYYGVPVVALDYKKFSSDTVLSLMSRHKVTCAFIPPTALKMIRREPEVLSKYPLHLRSIMRSD